MFEEFLAAALKRMGIEPPDPIPLRSIPLPREWGSATTLAFELARKGAEKRLIALPTDLSKKGRKEEEKRILQEETGALAADLAKELERMSLPGVREVRAEGGYVNLFYDPVSMGHSVISEILHNGSNLGKGKGTLTLRDPQHPWTIMRPLFKKDLTVMVEYSQPNTHKEFHIGHLRNVVLGDAIADLLDHAGYKVVRANYIGDVGAHTMKFLWGHINLFRGEIPVSDRGRWLGKVYSAAVEADPPEEEIRKLHQRWEQGDTEIRRLWGLGREWSIEEFEKIYEELGVHFDVVFYESELEDEAKEIAAYLLDAGIAKIDNGAIVVDIDERAGTKDEFKGMVILRSDGTTLYQTKDLALARRKFKDHKVDTSLYVVAADQSFYFKQIFKILDLMDFEHTFHCVHIPYELVNIESAKMSSREGNVINYWDFRDEMERRALEIVTTKNPDMPIDKAKTIAKEVALGASKFSMLSLDNTRVMNFDWDQALNFEGQAAPYIQYSYARSLRLLEGFEPEMAPKGFSEGLDAHEIILIRHLSEFEFALKEATSTFSPHIFCRYLLDLCKAFSDFYHNCPVLSAPDEYTKRKRQSIVYGFVTVVKLGFGLLKVVLPEEM